MLRLKNVSKIYPSGAEKVQALKDVSIDFRSSDLVSILGPSGCGKTTLLNIIGGLDKCSSGELVIDGISTAKYKDRDWDSYRNHSIGFVFQSYYLIPHQNVLKNVELSMTLSGVSKKERRERAIEALRQVGLEGQEKKKPNQLSGGQAQRVAIARAIVNNPDIVLADEPTGALDTETSLQVMDILKQISKDRLVIMVTHNPELAQKYSTRIINILDGNITADSSPLSAEEMEAELAKEETRTQERLSGKAEKKPSMSFSTSFGLSLRNLIAKKGRTFLTAFAGSIGIIGIALIYSVSNGTNNYINQIQEETLASYPITLEAKYTDMGSLLRAFATSAMSVQKHENDAIYEKSTLTKMLNSFNSVDIGTNDLGSFASVLEKELSDEDSELSESINAMHYSYSVSPAIYTRSPEGNILRSDSTLLLSQLMTKETGIDMSSMYSMEAGLFSNTTFYSSFESNSSLWQEILPGLSGELVSPLFEKQYDMIYGRMPSSYDEVLLVVDGRNELAEIVLYAMGLIPDSDMSALVSSAMSKSQIDSKSRSWSYEEIVGSQFKVLLPSDAYAYDESLGLWKELSLEEQYERASSLRIVGIVKAAEGATDSGAAMGGSIMYTSALTQHLMRQTSDSASVKWQLEHSGTDMFTGHDFTSSSSELTDEEKAAWVVKYYMEKMGMTGSSAGPSADAFSVPEPVDGPSSINPNGPMGYTAGATDTAVEGSAMSSFTGMNFMTGKDSYSDMGSFTGMGSSGSGAAGMGAMSGMGGFGGMNMSTEQLAAQYDVLNPSTDATYEGNLELLGFVDDSSPATISLYTATFAGKDRILAFIDEYNLSVDESRRIEYTDYVGLIMKSVTKIINSITYVLISFVAVSLIVSSIMIAVITLISVQERTKEIGILRSLGASKRNVSAMFNVETVIIGLFSGLIGVGFTYLVCIPINALLHSLTEIESLSAVLPPNVAAILVIISFLLTLVSGIIPSRGAAKKDPVVALRTE